jgi:hypothetical protein
MRLKIAGTVIIEKEISIPGQAPITAGTTQTFSVDWPIPVPQNQPLALKTGGNDIFITVDRVRI